MMDPNRVPTDVMDWPAGPQKKFYLIRLARLRGIDIEKLKPLSCGQIEDIIRWTDGNAA